jgi:hypothetical protein
MGAGEGEGGEERGREAAQNRRRAKACVPLPTPASPHAPASSSRPRTASWASGTVPRPPRPRAPPGGPRRRAATLAVDCARGAPAARRRPHRPPPSWMGVVVGEEVVLGAVTCGSGTRGRERKRAIQAGDGRRGGAFLGRSMRARAWCLVRVCVRRARDRIEAPICSGSTAFRSTDSRPILCRFRARRAPTSPGGKAAGRGERPFVDRPSSESDGRTD